MEATLVARRLQQSPPVPRSVLVAGSHPLHRLLVELVAGMGLPGGTAVARHPGGAVEMACAGRAGATGPIVTPEARLGVRPLAKVVLGLGVLRLVERGALDLDQPVSAYLDDDPATLSLCGSHATVGQLLSCSPRLDRLAGTRRRLRAGTLGGSASAPAGDLPGRDGGLAAWEREVLVLATVLERVTGEPLTPWLDDWVFAPLEMSSSTLVPGPGDTPAPLAGLRRSRQSAEPGASVFAWGTGTVLSSPADLARLLPALLGSPGRQGAAMLRRETLALAFTPRAPLPDSGLAFWLDAVDGRLLARAGGAGPGSVALCCLAPEDGAGLAVVLSADRFPGPAVPRRVEGLASGFVEGLLERGYGRRSLVG